MTKLFYSYRDGQVYMNGKETGYTTKVPPRTAEPLNGVMLTKVGEK